MLALIISLKGQTGEKIFEIPADATSFVVGRGEAADLRLRSHGVSKTHCRLTVLAGSKLRVEDLGSSNGCFVNGVKVKSQTLSPGDVLTLHDVQLKLKLLAPKAIATLSAPQFGNLAMESMDDPMEINPGYSQTEGSPQRIETSVAAHHAVSQPEFSERLQKWLATNVYPLADRLSRDFDVRILVGVFFLFWSLLVILFTAFPFSERANQRVQEQSIEVAKLYARQLVRINQKAIIDQRYGDLVSQLDMRNGQTPGLISAFVLDATRGRILAPATRLDEELLTPQAKRALAEDRDAVVVDSRGIAHVSSPIFIGTAEGNKIAAVAYVTYNTLAAQFSLGALLDQVTTSLLYTLLATILFLVFVARWTEGSINRLSDAANEALRRSDSSISIDVKWPALQNLSDLLSSTLGRSGSSASASDQSSDGRWAQAAVEIASQPAASYSASLQVESWNQGMSRLIGIEAQQAIGAYVDDASRDEAFPAAIKQLAAQASIVAWTPAEKSMELGGQNCILKIVYGNGSYLVSVEKLEG